MAACYRHAGPHEACSFEGLCSNPACCLHVLCLQMAPYPASRCVGRTSSPHLGWRRRWKRQPSRRQGRLAVARQPAARREAAAQRSGVDVGQRLCPAASIHVLRFTSVSGSLAVSLDFNSMVKWEVKARPTTLVQAVLHAGSMRRLKHPRRARAPDQASQTLRALNRHAWRLLSGHTSTSLSYMPRSRPPARICQWPAASSSSQGWQIHRCSWHSVPPLSLPMFCSSGSPCTAWSGRASEHGSLPAKRAAATWWPSATVP